MRDDIQIHVPCLSPVVNVHRNPGNENVEPFIVIELGKYPAKIDVNMSPENALRLSDMLRAIVHDMALAGTN